MFTDWIVWKIHVEAHRKGCGPMESSRLVHPSWWSLTLFLMQRLHCRAELWLLPQADLLVSQWKRPYHQGVALYHSWQTGYIRPLNPSQYAENFQVTGQRFPATPLWPLKWICVPNNGMIVPLSLPHCPPPPPGPYTLVRQFDHWKQVFQERNHSFLATSWVIGLKCKEL